MWLFIKVFLVFVFLYHILNTFFVYQLWINNLFFALSKDLLWIIFVFFCLIRNWKFLRIYFVYFGKYVLIFLFLSFLGILISLINWISFYDIMVGMKYDIFFLFIFLSSVFVWVVLFFLSQKQIIYNILNFLKKAIVFTLIVGFCWFGLKLLFPDFFIKNFGYWPVGDFVFGRPPPLYYRTGPWGLPRFSGIFAWPNNLWYFFVLFSSFFLYSFSFLSFSNSSDSKLKKNFLWSVLLFFVSWFLTLSRGFLLWILPQLFVWVKSLFFRFKISLKYFKYFLFFIVFFFLFLSFLKLDSSLLHFRSIFEGLKVYFLNIGWCWFGSSGPAVHHNWFILPENMYIQILIDIWFIGLVFWIWFFAFIFKDVISILKESKEVEKLPLYLKYLSLWILGLLLEGMFLHVFEDSMVNYLFFIPFGILFWYLYLAKFYKKQN